VTKAPGAPHYFFPKHASDYTSRFIRRTGAELEMYRLTAQARHRNRESSTLASALFLIANFTEVVFKPMVYSLSVGACPFLFLVMSLSGSQFPSTQGLASSSLTASPRQECATGRRFALAATLLFPCLLFDPPILRARNFHPRPFLHVSAPKARIGKRLDVSY